MKKILVLLLISSIDLEYIKAISRPTKTGTVKHSNGMCKNGNNIFQFLSVQVTEQVYINATDIEECYGTGNKIGKASYLPRPMAWTVWLTSTVPNVRAIENKFLQEIIFN